MTAPDMVERSAVETPAPAPGEGSFAPPPPAAALAPVEKSAVTPASPAQRWRRLPLAVRVTVAAGAVLVAFNLLLTGMDLATGGPAPTGPASSSYATAPAGLAAYADLLAAYGHPVRRLRATLDGAALDPRTTLVIADPSPQSPLSPAENRALRRFVRDGGRLVAAGADVVPSLGHVLGEAPVWASDGSRSARPLASVPEVAGISVVRAAGRGSWIDAGGTLPVLGDIGRGGAAASGETNGHRGGGGGRSRSDEDERSAGAVHPITLATVASAGTGRVVAIADSSLLQNAFLGETDNAAFAVALAGEAGRPVVFAEAPHGYGESEGLRAIPPRWRAALAGTLAATLVWMWSRGRRHGPPEDEERATPPPRRAYVDAMAASLAKTRQPSRSVLPLQEAARRRLARRAGLPPEADEEAIRRAAAYLGIAPAEVDALFASPRNDRELLAVGRAASATVAMAATPRPVGTVDQERRPW